MHKKANPSSKSPNAIDAATRYQAQLAKMQEANATASAKRDPARIARISALIAQAWAKVPDQRLGQLLENLLRFHEGDDMGMVWYTEDDKWEALLEGFVKTGRFKGE